jgi:MFS family permease
MPRWTFAAPSPAKAEMPENARTWIGYVAMCVGMFMAILDIQVVASSLTTIQNALHIPRDQLSWIQTAYLMAEIIAIPLTAMLTRALSLRWLFALATAGFTLASFACAFAPDADILIAIRVAQGFCGGMLIPSAGAGNSGYHNRRRIRDDRANAGAGRRRLSHRDIFLALDIFNQRHSRRCRERAGGALRSR